MTKVAFIFTFFLVLFAGCAFTCPGNRTELPAVTYTGLIVDARGTGARPSMTPKIVANGDSRVVYEGAMCDKQTLLNMGVASYARSIKAALDREQSGENPLVVRAIGTNTTMQDVMISSKDANLIDGFDQKNGFLKKCAVVIVLDVK